MSQGRLHLSASSRRRAARGERRAVRNGIAGRGRRSGRRGRHHEQRLVGGRHQRVPGAPGEGSDDLFVHASDRRQGPHPDPDGGRRRDPVRVQPGEPGLGLQHPDHGRIRRHRGDRGRLRRPRLRRGRPDHLPQPVRPARLHHGQRLLREGEPDRQHHGVAEGRQRLGLRDRPGHRDGLRRLPALPHPAGRGQQRERPRPRRRGELRGNPARGASRLQQLRGQRGQDRPAWSPTPTTPTRASRSPSRPATRVTGPSSPPPRRASSRSAARR